MTFQPGQSGNYRGRKPGSKNKRLALLRSAEPQLMRKLVKMARGGDMAAMKIVADRLWPRLRSEAAPIRIESPAKDLASFGHQILELLAAGRVAPDAAAEVMRALSAQAELIQHTEFGERLAAIEKLEAQRDHSQTAIAPFAGRPGADFLPRRQKRANS